MIVCRISTYKIEQSLLIQINSMDIATTECVIETDSPKVQMQGCNK